MNKSKIFITGKSCTGKTTLSYSLPGYIVYELDEIVKNIMKEYNLIENNIYKGTAPENIMNAFISEVMFFILSHTNKKIVINGAIRDVNLIKRLFDDSFTIIYLLPKNKEKYLSRVSKRFNEEMQTQIKNIPIDWTEDLYIDWLNNGMNGKLVEKVIKEFVNNSIVESQSRLNCFLANKLKMIVYDV